MFVHEGYSFIVGSTMLAAVAFGGALRFRSWPLWIAAFSLTLVAAGVCWFFRVPVPTA